MSEHVSQSGFSEVSRVDLDSWPLGVAFTGEWHYFRTDYRAWRARLRTLAGLGVVGVSIYVPWNLHQPDPERNPDFRGKVRPETNLLRALELVAEVGLVAILRPGPFITSEWLYGGLPDWLWYRWPDLLALNSRGQPASNGWPYPAITYLHPRFREAVARWLEAVAEAVNQYLFTRGGPIVNVQVDDEPSYFQKLMDPLALDYNPLLISPTYAVDSSRMPSERPDPEDGELASIYARWLLSHWGSLEKVAARHRVDYKDSSELAPPREHLSDPMQLPMYMDWFNFKLDQIIDFVGFCDAVLERAGIDVRRSMLQPYLLPVQGGYFAERARELGWDFQLTNECYLNLFRPSSFTEQKLGHIIAAMETYRMWCGERQGPLACMEMQGSMASWIGPKEMEILWATTLARGIKGVNLYMAVGGDNPEGFEHRTGKTYDLSAPIGPDGTLRPHAHVLKRITKIINAADPIALAKAETSVDAWIAGSRLYEASALAGGLLAMGEPADAIHGLFSSGEIGLGDTPSLAALLALANVSAGWLDIEAKDDPFGPFLGRGTLKSTDPIFVPGLSYQSRRAQERLLDHARRGGHVILMPGAPRMDEAMEPWRLLLDQVLPGFDAEGSFHSINPIFEGTPIADDSFSHVVTSKGELLVVPGKTAELPELSGIEVLARNRTTGVPCGVSARVEHGKITILGMRLRYAAEEDGSSIRFLLSLLGLSPTAVPERRRSAWAVASPVVAMELVGDDSGLLCVANPVDIPVSTDIYCRRGTIKVGSVSFEGRGAKLLPLGVRIWPGKTSKVVSASWELVSREVAGNLATLAFETRGVRQGEICLESVAQVHARRGCKVHDFDPRTGRVKLSASASTAILECLSS
jgi:beta-galactosidase